MERKEINTLLTKIKEISFHNIGRVSKSKKTVKEILTKQAIEEN